MHSPLATHLAYRVYCASALCLAAGSIGPEPRCEVAPVESAGLFEWGMDVLLAVRPLDEFLGPFALVGPEGRPPGGLHFAANLRS